MSSPGWCRGRPTPAAIVAAGILGLTIGYGPAALAQPADEASVRLNGVPVIQVTGAGSESAAVRAARVQRRLERIAARPDLAGTPTVLPGPSADSRIIQIGDALLVTVTAADAEEQLATVDALALEWASRLGAALDEARATRLSPWRRLGAEIRGSVVTAVNRLGVSATRIVPRAVAAIAVLVLFWAIAAGVRAILRFIFRLVISDLTVENLLKQLAYYAVWAIGILVAADALGFEPGTVITGLGLTGLALGFALKDIISNFVSGILILGLRPFEIGDEIVVGETEGSVQRIELRATEIRTYDGRVVLVPNAELFTSRVTNNTASPVRRASVLVPAGYGTDLALATRTLLQAVVDVPDVLPRPEPSVRVRELGTSDIELELRFWTDSRRTDLLAASSEVRRRVLDAFRQGGIGLPEPDVRRVRLAADPADDI
jgi:small conductance mechanosensitive channel